MINSINFENIDKAYSNSDLGLEYEKIEKILIGLLSIKPGTYSYKKKYFKDETESIVHDFFKEIGGAYLLKVKLAIEDNRLSFEKKQRNSHYKGRINVSLDGNIRDIFILVHELMHEFELDTNNLLTDSFLQEVVPITFEKVLSNYLWKTDCVKLDILSYEKERVSNTYNGMIDSLYEIMLINVKKEYGKITLDNIRKHMKMHSCDIWNNIDDDQLMKNLKLFKKDKKNYLYNLRYVVGQLVSVVLINNTDDINKLLGSLLLFSESNAKEIKERLLVLGIDIDNIEWISEYKKYYNTISVRTKNELNKMIGGNFKTTS